MNKRIDQLAAKAADFAALEVATNDGGLKEFNKLYMDKFAELIVEECIQACSDHDMESFGIFPIRALMVTTSCQKNIRRWVSEETDLERYQAATAREIERLERRLKQLKETK